MIVTPFSFITVGKIFPQEKESGEILMARAVRRFLVMLGNSLRIPPEMFCICGGTRRYTPPVFSYPTCEEAWAQDWTNIGLDFRRAVGRLNAEVAG